MPFPAPALEVLKRQLLLAWPAMGAANIGIMADARHIAAGTSDHIDGNAIDIPVAGGPGFDAMKALALQLLADARAHYAIWNRVFYHVGRAPAPYTGADPHTGHIHLSIDPLKRDQAQEWTFTGGEDMKLLEPVPAGWTRVYRLTHPNGDRLYTASVAEANAAQGSGYVFDGPAFDLSTTDPANTVTLWRLGKDGYHILTTGAETSALQAAGWAMDGPIGNVGSGGVKVVRLAKGAAHLYTANPAEAQAAVADGWTREGEAFGCGVAAMSDANEQIATLKTANATLAAKLAEVATAKTRFDSEYATAVK